MVAVQILATNLLIAIMCDSYVRIRQHADSHWKFGKIEQICMQNFHWLPPPLNLPVLLCSGLCGLVRTALPASELLIIYYYWLHSAPHAPPWGGWPPGSPNPHQSTTHTHCCATLRYAAL